MMTARRGPWSRDHSKPMNELRVHGERERGQETTVRKLRSRIEAHALEQDLSDPIALGSRQKFPGFQFDSYQYSEHNEFPQGACSAVASQITRGTAHRDWRLLER